MTSIKGKRHRISDNITYFFIYLCAAISVLLLLGIIVYVFVRGIGQINWEFLTCETSVLKGTLGIAGNLLNTLYIIVITMIIATPVGVGAAVYLNEYAKPGKLVSGIEFATETLSGIPSIIFGLFGMMFFGQTLGMGYSILTGSLTLVLMVLPLITRNTQEALKTVPDSYRHGAVGLGAGKWHTIRTILLPSAMPGNHHRCNPWQSDVLWENQQHFFLQPEVQECFQKPAADFFQRYSSQEEHLP